MNTPDTHSPPDLNPELQQVVSEKRREEGKRRLLLAVLSLLLLLLCGVGVFAIRYVAKPEPLPEMLPVAIAQNIYYPPIYKFSISGIDEPTGVAVSPDGQRIYVTEGAGERLIKLFDRDGNLINTFTPPGTTKSNRKLAYIAVAPNGNLFVTDHYNHVINVFDPDGNYIDGVINQTTTLSEFVSVHNNGNLPAGSLFYYDNINKSVFYQLPGEALQSIPGPEPTGWTPLGLRFDSAGNLLVTNLTAGKHSVLIFPASTFEGSLSTFDPQISEFGEEGKEAGQLSFPNSAVTDSRGNYYISDGNNGRISMWSAERQYQTFFAYGTSESALNLPRGNWMSSKDHLHVADAVGQFIRVYDVSGTEPIFLYSFGEYGTGEAMFNFPTDVCIDATGRVYVADSQNNRVQIWSY